MIILSFLFLLTATLYSSVGFGGGSTYLALLLIWDIPYLIFPVIALFCNIIVVSGNCINYIKAGNINLKILTPYLISSVPLAFIGGSLSVDKEVFEILLFVVLTLAGALLLLKFQSFDQKIEVYKKIPIILSLLIGASIGFVSGVVGIGGGIFLSPILLLVRVDSAKNIATAASLFILINSISGLAGQFTKASVINEIYSYWPLFLLVLLGGQLEEEENQTIKPSKLLNFYRKGYLILWDKLQSDYNKKIQFVKLIPSDSDSDINYLLLGINISNNNISKLIEIGKNKTKTILNVNSIVFDHVLENDIFIFDKNNYKGYYIEKL